MKNKFVFLMLGILLISLISALADVPPVPTLTAPASSGTVAGTYTINGTIVGESKTDGDLQHLWNITIFAYSPSTANSAYASVATANKVNYTRNGLNLSFTSSALEDSNDYYFIMQVVNDSDGNSTAKRNSSAVSSVIVDNTVPDPSGLSPTSWTDGTIIDSWSATVTGSRVTSCTMTITDQYGSALAAETMTHSGNTCTLTKYFTLGPGASWSVTGSDGTNTTSASASNVSVAKKGGGAAALYYAQKKKEAAGTVTLFDSVTMDKDKRNKALFLLVVAGGIFAYMSGWFGKKR